MGAGPGGPRRAGERLPSHLPARADEVQAVACHRATPPHAHRRRRLQAAALRSASTGRRFGRPRGTVGGTATSGLLPPRPAGGGRAGNEVGVQQPRVCRARADRRGRERPAVGSLPARAHLRSLRHGAHRPDPIGTGQAVPGHRVCAGLARPQAGCRPRCSYPGRRRDVLHRRRYRSLCRRPAEIGRHRPRQLSAETRNGGDHVPTALPARSTRARNGTGVRTREGGRSQDCWQDRHPLGFPFGDCVGSRRRDRGPRLQQHRRPRRPRRDSAARHHAPSSLAPPSR